MPLTISFAQEQLITAGAVISGGVIGAHQVGYGIAAFGSGPLLDAGVDLPTLFNIAAIAAVALAAIAFVLTSKRPALAVHGADDAVTNR